jgi:hypothetical protein
MEVNSEMSREEILKIAKANAAKNAVANAIQAGNTFSEGVEINFTSESGQTYKGIIDFKRATVKDYMNIGAKKSEYLRRAGVQDITLVDGSVKYIAQIVSTLEVLVTECPDWFKNIDSIEDIDLLYHVYDKFDQWDSSFRRKQDAEPAGDTDNAPGSEAMGTA